MLFEDISSLVVEGGGSDLNVVYNFNNVKTNLFHFLALFYILQPKLEKMLDLYKVLMAPRIWLIYYFILFSLHCIKSFIEEKTCKRVKPVGLHTKKKKEEKIKHF